MRVGARSSAATKDALVSSTIRLRNFRSSAAVSGVSGTSSCSGVARSGSQSDSSGRVVRLRVSRAAVRSRKSTHRRDPHDLVQDVAKCPVRRSRTRRARTRHARTPNRLRRGAAPRPVATCRCRVRHAARRGSPTRCAGSRTGCAQLLELLVAPDERKRARPRPPEPVELHRRRRPAPAAPCPSP